MTKGRILFVEDNMDTYKLVRFFMEHNGYEVFLAVNGRDAADAAIKQKPNLILMDLAVPAEMDGWDVSKRIKSNPITKNIPIIAVSMHALVSERKRAFNTGCDDYITKPIDLVRMVDQALKL